MKTRLTLFLISLVFLASCKEPEARRPVSYSKSHTLVATIDPLKKVNSIEERKIEAYIKRDSTATYLVSPNGYWYQYLNKVDQEANTAQKGDIAELSYEILDLNNQVIYSKEELGIKEYKVDKEDFIPALQQGIKTMKKGETIKFVIPSYNAFGVVGDNNKIGINESIISIVTIINIKENPENEN